MPTVRTHSNGNIILKDNKVSCECCETVADCAYATLEPFANSQAAISEAQYVALYAGGTWSMAASGNVTSTGSGGDFLVTTQLTASGTAANSYSVASPTCSSNFGLGSSTGSVSVQGTFTDNEEPPFVFLYDYTTGNMETRMGGYRIYNSGGPFPYGIWLNARASFYAQYVAAVEATSIFGPPSEGFFPTDCEFLLTTRTGGGSSIVLVVGGSPINLPAILESSSLNNDVRSGNISLTITFTPSAP